VPNDIYFLRDVTEILCRKKAKLSTTVRQHSNTYDRTDTDVQFPETHVQKYHRQNWYFKLARNSRTYYSSDSAGPMVEGDFNLQHCSDSC